MSLISTSISNLVGGVSQQSPALRLPNQCEKQENALASAFEGLTKRPPTEHVARLSAHLTSVVDLVYDSAYIHTINRSESEQYVVVFARGETSGGTSIYVYDINGNFKTVHAPNGTPYVNEPNIDTKLRCVTVADVTFVVNREKTVTASSSLSPNSRGTTNIIPQALVWVRQSNYKRKYVITITKGVTKTYTHTTGTTAVDAIGTEDVATALVTAYTADAHTGLTLVRTGNVLFFYGAAATDTFAISVSDDFGGDGMMLTTDTAVDFDQLPDKAPHGYLVKVKGSEGSEGDDYYVKFVQSAATTSTTTPSSGYWQEDQAGGLIYDLDKSTMPHILVRNSDDTFNFQQADGLATSGYTHTYPDFVWLPRAVGDDDTSPMPAFVGQKIRDLNFFRDRLVILSGEYITTSEIGDPFNFFPTTVQEVVESDPIEVGSTQPSVMDLKSSVVFSDRLVVFSPQSQLTLKGDGFLGPKTVSLTQSAAFENLDVAPIASGTSIFFGFNRGSFSGVREMVISNSLDLQFDATDITVQVPQYLPGAIKKMTASTHENLVVALCRGDASSLYVYKYFNQGDQRVQSAWSRFTFRNATILDAQFLDTTLYIVVKRGLQTVIEKIRLESGRNDTGSSYLTTLDRRVAGSSLVSRVYTSSTDTTTLTLPYTITSTDPIEVVTATGLRLNTTFNSTTSVKVPGDHASTDIWVGETYSMLYEFSEQLLKTASQSGGLTQVTTGRYQLRYGTIAYGSSAFFRVKVTLEAGSTFEYVFTGRTLGALNNTVGVVSIDSGSFRFPIYSRNSQVKVSVENDSPLPSNLLSAEYEALFVDRTLRR